MNPRLPNGANVLLLLRDQTATDLKSLCEHFHIDVDGHLVWYVTNVLDELREADYIVSVPAAQADWRNVKIAVTQRVFALRSALGLSLTDLARSTPDSITVTPFFGRPQVLEKPHDVFVLMPFAPVLRPVYDDHIVSVVNHLSLRSKRADDFFTTGHVISDIWRGIWSARLIIADCTGRNANVFYEIGMAHTLGKPVVLITQSQEDIPFDLRYIRYLHYQYTPPGMKDFEARLESTIQAELSS